MSISLSYSENTQGLNDGLPLALSGANVQLEEHNASRGWQGEYGSGTKT